jgi:hypothetical protein
MLVKLFILAALISMAFTQTCGNANPQVSSDCLNDTKNPLNRCCFLSRKNGDATTKECISFPIKGAFISDYMSNRQYWYDGSKTAYADYTIDCGSNNPLPDKCGYNYNARVENCAYYSNDSTSCCRISGNNRINCYQTPKGDNFGFGSLKSFDFYGAKMECNGSYISFKIMVYSIVLILIL